MKTLLPISAATVFFDGIFHTPVLAHPECIAVHSDGSIYAGTENGDLVRIEADGSDMRSLANSDGFLLGIALDSLGNCYACDMKHAAIFKYDTASQTFQKFADSGIVVPNFPVIDEEKGYLYVSDSFSFEDSGGGIFRYDLKNGDGKLWTTEPMNFANGMAMATDRSGLYVVESTKQRLSFVPILSDGGAGVPEVIVSGLETVPDGVLVMPNGDLLISNYEPSRIYHYSQKSGLQILIEDTLATTLAHPTNIALKDGKLFTANLGRWHISEVDLSRLQQLA
jgi:gluconolactonase